MRALSASTRIPDAYRAGVFLGEQLSAVAPEVVFLFTSIDYGANADILEGLNDGLADGRCLVIGSSGDGYYEAAGASELGAAALGLNSDGTVRWRLEIGDRVTDDPAGATRRALAGHRDASLLFMVSDYHADASLVEQVLEREIDVPVVGGFAADNQQWRQCALYANRTVLSDCVVALAAEGPLKFAIHIENSITPVGAAGRIDSAEGTRIDRISGMPAMRFIEQATGKPVLSSDRGVTSLTIINADEPDIKRLRSIAQDFTQSESSLQLYGGIAPGQQVQVCLAQPEQIIDEVYRLAGQATYQAFTPAAAVIVSCAGRKKLLGARLTHEVRAISEALEGLAIVGFPSLGEIGPLRTAKGYSANLFHNMTYVLLLIGS